jgi:signal transduction histidine kinase
MVEARREELIQVLLNLLDNAREAGATRVTITLAGRQVVVTDDGRGIAEEQLERIFEPTFSTTTSGTGLGLAIVRRLVEGWGARVSAGTGPGGGASFMIEFPEPGSTLPGQET